MVKNIKKIPCGREILTGMEAVLFLAINTIFDNLTKNGVDVYAKRI